VNGGGRDPFVRPGAPHVLREYAVLADGHRGALVGPRGDISWMCAPRWDSGAVFSTLIGGRSCYSVTPCVPYAWGGAYEPGTLIWHSRWVTHEGIIECREALAYPGDPNRIVLLRRIEAIDCRARVDVTLQPRADYDTAGVHRWVCHDGVWTATAAGLRIRWTGGTGGTGSTGGTGGTGAEAAEPGALRLHVDLARGDHHDLVLEISATDLPDQPPSPDQAWDATISAWQRAVPPLDGVRAPRDTRQSFAVLRGLTGPGGTVAAATTSLPERAGDDRNYDYRYVWVRDQCFIGRAAAACQAADLLDQSVRVVTELLLEHGENTAPAYTVAGEPVPSQRHLTLPGYPGGHDVIGNHVHGQFQLDVFGEALLLFADAARLDCMDAQRWRAARAAVQAVERRWQQPDAGIWELDARPWTHSRLICAAGLRAIAAAAPSDCSSAAGWVTLADGIVADTARTSVHPDGRWQRAADDPALDAALLFAGLGGAVPADDPRTVATLTAYLRELTVDGYAYRYRHGNKPLHEAEGSFLLCGFATALALHQQGREIDAVAWYERTRAACGPPVLFSEEFDAIQHQMRGNLPQAFVHALMIESSARLIEEE
jgi:GH15 family glucan-1,4-alpha-glucosidase